MKKIFMTELYNEMKLEKRSKYLVTNTNANRIWLFPDIPVGKRKRTCFDC